jgi:hypothetical protein
LAIAQIVHARRWGFDSAWMVVSVSVVHRVIIMLRQEHRPSDIRCGRSMPSV